MHQHIQEAHLAREQATPARATRRAAAATTECESTHLHHSLICGPSFPVSRGFSVPGKLSLFAIETRRALPCTK